MENKVKCINCDWLGEEDELALVEFDSNDEEETCTAIEYIAGHLERRLPMPLKRDFLKGCPRCETDSYLMDIRESEDE